MDSSAARALSRRGLADGDCQKNRMSEQHIGADRFHELPTLCLVEREQPRPALAMRRGPRAVNPVAGGHRPRSGACFCSGPFTFPSVNCFRSVSQFPMGRPPSGNGFPGHFLRPVAMAGKAVAPARRRRRLALWLLRWLLFRLMFESGWVKLLSGDPSWWHLTALRVHYETQPLPTWIGWYAHQLPAGLPKRLLPPHVHHRIGRAIPDFLRTQTAAHRRRDSHPVPGGHSADRQLHFFQLADHPPVPLPA